MQTALRHVTGCRYRAFGVLLGIALRSEVPVDANISALLWKTVVRVCAFLCVCVCVCVFLCVFVCRVFLRARTCGF